MIGYQNHFNLTMKNILIFSSPVRKYRELLLSFLCLRRCGHERGCHTLKFYVKDFYITGKALSGELSCTGTGLVIW